MQNFRKDRYLMFQLRHLTSCSRPTTIFKNYITGGPTNPALKGVKLRKFIAVSPSFRSLMTLSGTDDIDTMTSIFILLTYSMPFKGRGSRKGQ